MLVILRCSEAKSCSENDPCGHMAAATIPLARSLCMAKPPAVRNEPSSNACQPALTAVGVQTRWPGE